jgi:hypothetical protein
MSATLGLLRMPRKIKEWGSNEMLSERTLYGGRVPTQLCTTQGQLSAINQKVVRRQ